MNPTLLLLIPLLPLAGFLVNGLMRPKEPIPGILASLAVLGSFLLSLLACGTEARTYTYFSWIATGQLSIDFAFRLDALSQHMILIVTGVGFLIHVYSIGYMHKDPGYARFFSYLNLFTFAMLILVLGASLPLLFVGWEGVGLCSYLLIGFWFKELARADAGKKAFIVNRVGDFGFLLGMFGLFYLLGTFNFAEMPARLAGVKATALTIPCLLLFLGACGKSAQIPLFVWLPDAMAGPTPVSALIHAATMVTAGVYMVVRLNFVFSIAPDVMEVIGLVAAATAVLTGVMGMTQYNLKKVLAYSTISQLSYMFCGVAASGFDAGVFHLTTHAFFKALLFLGAGAVIHALGNEEDMRKMGGLRKSMPLAYACFAVGGWCLVGLPPFSGFFSKESILGACFSHGGYWSFIGALLLVGAVITGFYTTRMFLMTFHGEGRHHEAHGTPMTMAVPLVILIVLSASGGLLEFVLPHQLAKIVPVHEHAIDYGIMALGVGTGALGVLLALKFKDRFEGALAQNRNLQRLPTLLDEIYDFAIVLPLQMTAFVCWLVIDRAIIDNFFINRSTSVLYAGTSRARAVQSGAVSASVAVLAGGAAVFLWLLTYGWLKKHG